MRATSHLAYHLAPEAGWRERQLFSECAFTLTRCFYSYNHRHRQDRASEKDIDALMTEHLAQLEER